MNWYVARAALVQFLHIEDDGQGQANVHEELERDWSEKIRNTFSCQWFFLFLHIVFFYILFEKIFKKKENSANDESLKFFCPDS